MRHRLRLSLQRARGALLFSVPPDQPAPAAPACACSCWVQLPRHGCPAAHPVAHPPAGSAALTRGPHPAAAGRPAAHSSDRCSRAHRGRGSSSGVQSANGRNGVVAKLVNRLRYASVACRRTRCASRCPSRLRRCHTAATHISCTSPWALHVTPCHSVHTSRPGRQLSLLSGSMEDLSSRSSLFCLAADWPAAAGGGQGAAGTQATVRAPGW